LTNEEVETIIEELAIEFIKDGGCPITKTNKYEVSKVISKHVEPIKLVDPKPNELTIEYNFKEYEKELNNNNNNDIEDIDMSME